MSWYSTNDSFPAAVQRAALPAGTSVHNDYILEKPLRVCGLELTYLARDSRTQQPVYLRELLPMRWCMRDENGIWTPYHAEAESLFSAVKSGYLAQMERLQMFCEESAVEQILAVFEAGGTVWIASEYAQEYSAAEALAAKLFTPQEAISLLTPVMDTLVGLHEEKLYHGAISLHSVMLREDTAVLTSWCSGIREEPLTAEMDVRAVSELLYRMMRENPQIRAWILNYTDLEHLDWTSLLQQAGDLMGDSLSTIFGSAVSAVGNVISGVWSVFVSLVFCFYCLGNKEQLARQGGRILYAVLPERWADEIIRIFRLTNSTFSNFFSGQCLEVCILGSMFAVTMTVFRMPYVSLVSVLVAVTAFIPIVGAWIGCVFGAFFILVNDPLQAVGFVVMFLVLQQIENNLVYPRVVGTSVGLPSMWTLFSVSIGGKLMGVAGMVLMIPMVSVIYTLIGDYTGKLVRKKGIAPEKLTDQPPELKSKLKEKRELNRKKREARRAAQLAEVMKQSFHIPERHPVPDEKKENDNDT